MACIQGPPPDIEDPDLNCTLSAGQPIPDPEPPSTQPVPTYTNTDWDFDCIPPDMTYADLHVMVDELLTDMNKNRTEHGMQPLQHNDNLTYAAFIHATYLYDSWSSRKPGMDFDGDGIDEHTEQLTHEETWPPVIGRETTRDRTNEAGFLHGKIIETFAGEADGAGSPMDAYGGLKTNWTGDDPGAFAPYVQDTDPNIADLKYIGIGWKNGVYVFLHGAGEDTGTVIQPAPNLQEAKELICVEDNIDPLTEPCAENPPPDATQNCPPARTYEKMHEESMDAINEMNRYRKSKGMQPLFWSPHLTAMAQWQATFVAEHGATGPCGTWELSTHCSIGGPHGDNLTERKQEVGFLGTIGEGIAAGGATNPLYTFCGFKDEYVDENNMGHFGPFFSTEGNSQNYRWVGIGWKDGVTVFNYGGGNAGGTFTKPVPPIEDPDLLCDASPTAPGVPPEAAAIGWDYVPEPETTFGSKSIDPSTLPCVEDKAQNLLPVKCPTVRTYEINHQVAQPMIDEVNRIRYNRGLPPLKWSDNLAAAAQWQASYQYDNNFLGHVSPNLSHGTTLSERVQSAGFKSHPQLQPSEAGQGNQLTEPANQGSIHGYCYFKNTEWPPGGEPRGHILMFLVDRQDWPPGKVPPPTDPTVQYTHIGYGWKGGRKTYVFGSENRDGIPHGPVPPIEDPDLLCL